MILEVEISLARTNQHKKVDIGASDGLSHRSFSERTCGGKDATVTEVRHTGRRGNFTCVNARGKPQVKDVR